MALGLQPCAGVDTAVGSAPLGSPWREQPQLPGEAGLQRVSPPAQGAESAPTKGNHFNFTLQEPKGLPLSFKVHSELSLWGKPASEGARAFHPFRVVSKAFHCWKGMGLVPSEREIGTSVTFNHS